MIDPWLLPGSARGPGGRFSRRGAAYAAFALVTVVCTWPLAAQLGNKVAGGMGDPLLNAWVLAWNQRCFLRLSPGIFDPNIFHPVPAVSALTDYQWVPALLTLPIRVLTSNPLFVYNLCVLLAFLLAAIAFFEFGFWLTRDASCSVGGALLATFTPYRFAQLHHLQIMSSHFVILVVFLVHRMIADPRRRGMTLLLALSVTAQYLTGFYHTVFLAVHAPLFALLLVLHYRRHLRARPSLLRLAASAALTALLLAPFILNSLRVLPHLHAGGTDTYRARLFRPIDESIVSVHGTNRTWSRALPTGQLAPNCLFPGAALLIFGIIGLASRRFRFRMAYGALFVLPLIMADGRVFRFASRVCPVLETIRAPGRQAMLAYTGLGICALYGLRAVLDLVANGVRGRWVAVGVVGALAVVESWAVPLPVNKGEILTSRWPGHHLALGDEAPPVYGWLANADSVRVVAEVPDLPKERFIYQFYSTLHWKRMISGASGRTPPLSAMAIEALHEFPSDRSLCALRSLGVDCVIVHYGIGGRVLGRVSKNVASLPPGRLRVTYKGGGSVAYQLEPDFCAAAPADLSSTLPLPPPLFRGAPVGDLVDGSLATGWKVPPSDPDPTSLLFRFPTPPRITGLVLCLGEWYRSYPRSALVKARPRDGGLVVLNQSDGLFPWLPSMLEGWDRGKIYLPLAPTEVAELELVLPRREPERPWAIAEIQALTTN